MVAKVKISYESVKKLKGNIMTETDFYKKSE